MNLKLALATCITVLLSTPLMAETLVIYNWAEYLGKNTIAEFENTTGHKIREVYFDNEGDRDRAILSLHRGEYDLIMFDLHSLDLFTKNKLLKDLSSLPILNKGNQSADFTKTCGPSGIPYGWGTTGIAYRKSIINQKVSSWQTLFSPPGGARNRIVMPLDEVDTSSVLLMALGKPVNSDQLEDLEAAMALLKLQMPYLIKYGYGITYAELHGKQSKMAMTMAYSSDIETLSSLTEQDDWHYVVPEEGSSLWVDCWAIPDDKPASQAAIDFLSYLNDPVVAAKNAEEVAFTTTNSAAKEHFSNTYLNNPILNPPPDVLARSLNAPVLSAEALRLRNWLVFSAKSNFKAISN